MEQATNNKRRGMSLRQHGHRFAGVGGVGAVPKWSHGASVLVASLLCVRVLGATVSYTDIHDYDFAGNLDVSVLTLNKFSGPAGTLTGVTLTLTWDFDGWMKYENTDTSPYTVDASQSISVTLSPPTSLFSYTSPLEHSASFAKTEDLPAKDGVVDYDGPSGRTYDPSLSGSYTDSSPTPKDLNLFYGAVNDTFTIDIAATATTSGLSSGNLKTDVVSLAKVTATVEYAYVPEVSQSAWLLGLAACGVAVGCRRRMRKGRPADRPSEGQISL